MSSLSSAFRNIALQKSDGTYSLTASHVHPDGTSHDVAPFPLDLVLGNIDGTFKWGYKAFSQSARSVTLDGTILKAELLDTSGNWKDAEFDLDNKFAIDEKESGEAGLKAEEVPAVVYLPDAVVPAASEPILAEAGVVFDSIVPAAEASFALEATTVQALPEFRVQVATGEGDDAKIGYATTGANVTNTSLIDGVVSHVDTGANASASVFHVEQTKGGPIAQSKVDILTVGAEAKAQGVAVGDVIIPKYAGVDASVNLVKMETGPFSLNLGVGANTDIGIKDTSVEVHVAGCGVTVGTTIGISAFGSGFSIDFTKLFG